MIVADNVRAEMGRLRWTGRKAAMALGLSQPYLARRLSGDVPLDANDLAALASLLEVSVSRFFENVDPLETRKTARGGASDGLSLLDLDSNQEPTGYMPAAVFSLTDRLLERADDDVETDGELISLFEPVYA